MSGTTGKPNILHIQIVNTQACLLYSHMLNKTLRTIGYFDTKKYIGCFVLLDVSPW